MTLLETVKNTVRIRDSVSPTPAEEARTEDIKTYIFAAKDELRRVGIREDCIIDSDARVVQACKLFVMASLDYHGKGSEYHDRFIEYTKAFALDAARLEDPSSEGCHV